MTFETAKPPEWKHPPPVRSAILVLALTALAGCASLNPLPGFGVGEGTPDEARITKLMKWHSARVEVYREFRTVFSARAVYLSEEIRRLAADWEARSKLLTPGERSDLLERAVGEEKSEVRILLGFYTPEEELNDLDREDSAWITYLKNSDGTVTRATCSRAVEEDRAMYMRFLGWDLSWSRLYLLCFPNDPALQRSEDGWITLVISGPRGLGELRLRAVSPEEAP